MEDLSREMIETSSATALGFTAPLLPNKVSPMINLEVEEHLLQIFLVTCNEKAIEHDFFLWRHNSLNTNNN